MVHYKPVKVKIDVPGIAKIILDMIVKYHGFLDSIVSDRVL